MISQNTHKCRIQKLVEDDTLVVVHNDPIFNMGLDGMHENVLLQQSPDTQQIIHFVAVGYASNILLNNWAFVQVGRRVMRRRSDQLDPARVRSVIRFAAHEGW